MPGLVKNRPYLLKETRARNGSVRHERRLVGPFICGGLISKSRRQSRLQVTKS